MATATTSYTFSSLGAAPMSVVLGSYQNRSPQGGNVDLGTPGQPVIKYQLVTKTDSVDLSDVPFALSRTRAADGTDVLSYSATVRNAAIRIRYSFAPRTYVVRTAGQVSGVQGAYLLVSLPRTFRSFEADTANERAALSYAFLSKRSGARNVPFGSLDPGEQALEQGPLGWVAAKSKYFVVGIVAPANGTQFAEATLTGGARTSKVATNASATVVVPVTGGSFAFDMYAGPQAYTQLSAVGRNFDEVNPYGWGFLRGVLQPIANGVIRVVLWMHQRLNLQYGWVLIVLGVAVRLVLWPLNQGALRSQLKMQEIQPRIQEVQKRYKDNPEKQRDEIMKVYKESGTSPFSALSGCLPMLLPMPVLLALYFVFQSTIEFRGVSFLWLNDLSVYDPLYLLPFIMGVSMYLMSWVSMRNMPPNPQTKMMSYMMPVLFTVFLVKASAGINLYYAVQNLAGLPQQWLIARERASRAKT